MTADFPTPVVESTGTGGGLKLFCGGLGVAHATSPTPRAASSARRSNCAPRTALTTSPRSRSASTASPSANSRAADRLELTLRQLFLALAKTFRWTKRGRNWRLIPIRSGARSTRAAGHRHRGAGPAADFRHPRRFRRTGAGRRLQDLPRPQGAERRGQEPLQGHLPRDPRGRRLCGSGRERRVDRAETGREPQRLRSLRVQLPGPERR